MLTAEEISITATEATVAGSSVAVTEAEEDAASFAPSTGGGDNNSTKGKCILTKESSVKGISIANDDDEDDDEDEEYAAPMHLHALRTPAKLRGVRSRSSSRSRPGSRRNSTSPARKAAAMAGGGELILGGINLSPSQSVDSSLDGVTDQTPGSSLAGDSVIDADILLDKLGFRDLDPNTTHEEMQELLQKHMGSNSSLPTLNERMSEETMDDVHAFQDLKFVKRSSACSSKDESDGGDGSPNADLRDTLKKSKAISTTAIVGSTSYLLNTLDEEAEGEGDEDDDANERTGVILENIDGVVTEGASRTNHETLNSTLAVIGDVEDEDEECETGDVIVEIPEGMVKVKEKSLPARESIVSTRTVRPVSSMDEDDVGDDDDAEVDVPTSVMEELEISVDKRKLNHRDTSLAVVAGDVDYLEDDEQDGFEADREEEEPR